MSSNSSSLPQFLLCFITSPGDSVFNAFNVANILILLPLCTFILCYSLREWRKRRSSPSSSSSSPSHSDVFTYHAVAMEMLRVFGCVTCRLGVHVKDVKVLLAGSTLLFFTWFGETSFHVLTCVECHLAVVHPVAYLRLRGERGVRARNAAVAAVWLLCVLELGLFSHEEVSLLVNFSLVTVGLAVVSFCSVSVLRVLVRPGPGEKRGGAAAERADQSKKRAFNIMAVILGALLLRFSWFVFWGMLSFLGRDTCAPFTLGLWSSLPSSLVLPLLFLHRQFKLLSCK